MSDRKKPALAFRATVAAVCLPLIYVVSLGPACWLVDRGYVAAMPIAKSYRPVLLATPYSPRVAWHAIQWFVGIFCEDAESWTLTRVMDAAGLFPHKAGHWPLDPR